MTRPQEAQLLLDLFERIEKQSDRDFIVRVAQHYAALKVRSEPSLRLVFNRSDNTEAR